MNTIFATVLGIVFLLFAWFRPGNGTLIAIFLLYMNFPAVGKNFMGIPELLAGGTIFVLMLPQLIHIMLRREKLIVDEIFGLMCVFLTVVLVTCFSAKNLSFAWDWIFVYITEGLILYFFILNVIRDMKMLKRAIWVLLLACSIQGGLSLYQDVTRSYNNTFFGFAQREVEDVDLRTIAESALDREKAGGKDRVSGPIGETNRYAQTLITMLPLAVFLVLGGRSLPIKLLAAGASMLMLSGILLTFSRGGFVTLVLMLLLMMILRQVRTHQVVGVVSVLVLLMVFAAPGYFGRLETLKGVEALFSDTATVEADGATRGRATEMLAAFNVFIDHPLLGVGPGQYVAFYSVKYHLNQDDALRHIPIARRAHSLYFELAAETGIIGFVAFMYIPFFAMYRLWQLRVRARQCRPDITNLSTAFFFCMIGYLGSAIFLHFAFQRYYWFLLAMVGAAIQVLHAELQNERSTGLRSSKESTSRDTSDRITVPSSRRLL